MSRHEEESGLLRYIGRRGLGVLLVIVAVLTLVFFAQRLSGDPVALLVPQGATSEDVARVRSDLGLDQPLPVQYAKFIAAAATGDFGESFRYRQPALQVVIEALTVTIQLTVVAMAAATLGALILGILAAIYRGSLVDLSAMSLSVIGQSMPNFWLGILLILFFAVQLGLLPTGGWGEPEHFVLPTITLAAYSMARISRLVRSGMLEVLGQDFVRTAWSKGLTTHRVVLRHALRNALLPVLTVIGLEFAVLLGGAVITETIFGIPGIGRLTVESVLGRDYPVVLAGVFVFATVVTIQNFLVDIAYSVLDPRIRIA